MKKVIWACLALLLAACSSGSSSSGGGGTVIITGTWSGQLVAIIAGHSAPMTWVLSQINTEETIGDNNAINPEVRVTGDITGTAAIPSTGQGCFSGGTITGTILGNVVTLQIADANGATIDISGTVSGNMISGVFSSSGGPCGATSGNFKVTLVG
ncbi:MAG: hypothetical protein OEU36_20420 [Gammaproteobacteria bacterium]|nr:hypothetical protein [Gammaproteobacteria bacterium]